MNIIAISAGDELVASLCSLWRGKNSIPLIAILRDAAGIYGYSGNSTL